MIAAPSPESFSPPPVSHLRHPTVRYAVPRSDSEPPPARLSDRPPELPSPQESRRSFEGNVVKALWEDTALDRFVTPPGTHERVQFLPSVETLRFLQEQFKGWIEPSAAEVRAAMRHAPDQAEEIEDRFRQSVLLAMHQPLSSVPEAPEATGRPLAFAEALKFRVFAIRGLLSGNPQGFTHLDRLFLNGRPPERLQEAWSEAIDRNELIRINAALGVSGFPLHELGPALAARGLQEEAGVCHPTLVSPLEKQADAQAHRKGKDIRLGYQEAQDVAFELYPEIREAQKALEETLSSDGDLPMVDDWAVHVALKSQRYGQIEERKAQVERDLGPRPDSWEDFLADEAEVSGRKPSIAELKVDDHDLLRQSLIALRAEQLELTLQREAYRRIGSHIDFLTSIGALPAHGGYSLQAAINMVGIHLRTDMWKQKSPQDPYEHGSDSTRR